MIGPREITADALKAAIAAALQAIAQEVGRPVDAWEVDSAMTIGVDPRTFRRWIAGDGETPPSLESFARLCTFFGPDFHNEVWGLTGYVVARQDDAAEVEDLTRRAEMRKGATTMRASAAHLDDMAGPGPARRAAG